MLSFLPSSSPLLAPLGIVDGTLLALGCGHNGFFRTSHNHFNLLFFINPLILMIS